MILYEDQDVFGIKDIFSNVELHVFSNINKMSIKKEITFVVKDNIFIISYTSILVMQIANKEKKIMNEKKNDTRGKRGHARRSKQGITSYKCNKKVTSTVKKKGKRKRRKSETWIRLCCRLNCIDAW